MLSPFVMSTFTVSIFRSHHTHSTVRPIATDSVATDVPRSGVLVHVFSCLCIWAHVFRTDCGFPGLFADTSEHRPIRFVVFSFSVFHYLVLGSVR